jgi:glycosyltransferase involved in cell wall biosynthesis
VKIAFDYQIFFLQKYGGISRYIVRIAELLGSLGGEAKIFAPIYINRHLHALNDGLKKGYYVEKYINKTGRVMNFINNTMCDRNIASWIPDVIHETYYKARVPETPKCPRVVTVHDMIHELFPDAFPAEDRTAELKREAVLRADHIICVSESTRKDLQTILDIPSAKVSVIHHGPGYIKEVDAGEQGDKECVKDRLESPYLLYVGPRRGYKNFKGLLKGLALSTKILSDLSLVLFGGGDISESERGLIGNMKVKEGRIIHISGDDALLRALYADAEALVYPSLYEGFGFPPLEAMGLGCPVVCSCTSSLPEIVGDAGMYFDPYQPESIANAIEKIIYSEALRKEIVRLGYIRVKKFAWETCASSTMQIYNKIINDKS